MASAPHKGVPRSASGRDPRWRSAARCHS